MSSIRSVFEYIRVVARRFSMRLELTRTELTNLGDASTLNLSSADMVACKCSWHNLDNFAAALLVRGRYTLILFERECTVIKAMKWGQANRKGG